MGEASNLKNLPITFPLAPQPDIVRASQKDEYFKKRYTDNLFELVQYYMGACGRVKSVV